MKSYPYNDLPLTELLRFAADHRLTTAIDMRNQITAGRIDIVGGQVVDAHLGGLSREEAVYAALSSEEMCFLRGRTPKSSTPRRIALSTEQLLRQAACRKVDPLRTALDTRSRSNHEQKMAARSTTRHVRFAVFMLGCLTLLALFVLASWRFGPQNNSTSLPMRLGQITESIVEPTDAAIGEVVPAKFLAATGPARRIDFRGEVAPVVVDVLVDENGAVRGAKIDQVRPGWMALEDAAIASAMSAQFAPGTRRGQSVTTWTKVLVRVEPSSGVLATTDSAGQASQISLRKAVEAVGDRPTIVGSL